MNEQENHNTENSPALVPMWEAMDCADVTDDPFYDDFTEGGDQ